MAVMSQITPDRDVRYRSGSSEAGVPRAAAQLAKPGSISFHLSDFKRTGNPLSLFKAGATVIRQGRLREVLYGVRCFLTARPAPVTTSGMRGASFEHVVDDLLAIHQEIRSAEFDRELRGRFPVHLLPADLVTFTHIFAHTDDWMIVGEYADASARMYFLNRDSCTPIPYYTTFEGVRHIHSVHRLSDTQVAISTGDKAKLFDLWDVNAAGMTFSKRLMRHHGGFLSSAKVGDDDYFGTDFSHRPNYLYRYRDGKRWFFPQPAFTKYVLRLRAVDDRYLVSLNTGLLALSADDAWTVFDTYREEFVHAAALGKKAFGRLTRPKIRIDRPLSAGIGFPLPQPPMIDAAPSVTP